MGDLVFSVAFLLLDMGTYLGYKIYDDIECTISYTYISKRVAASCVPEDVS